MSDLAEQCRICCEIVDISLMHIPSGLCCRCHKSTFKHDKKEFDKLLSKIRQSSQKQGSGNSAATLLKQGSDNVF